MAYWQKTPSEACQTVTEVPCGCRETGGHWLAYPSHRAFAGGGVFLRREELRRLTAILAAAIAVDGVAQQERFPVVLEPANAGRAPGLGADSGTRNLATVVRAAEHGLDLLSDTLEPDGPPAWVLRASRTLFAEVPLALWATWVAHETFGHGARCVELGMRPCRIAVAVSPPFNVDLPGQNFVSFDGTPTTLDRLMVFQVAGLAAEQLFADELVRRAVESRRWSRAGAAHMVIRAGELLVKALLDSPATDDFKYGDQLVRRNLTFDPQHTRAVARGTLMTAIALDPTLWFSIYDYFWNWLALGRAPGALPDLLPGPLEGWIRPRYQQAPWSVEVGLDVVAFDGLARYEGGFLVGRNVAGFTGAAWLDAPLPFGGGALEARARVAGWIQEPELIHQVAEVPRRLGAAVELDATYYLWKNFGPHARVGVKSHGLWLGRPLDPGVYGQLGAEVRL